MQTNLLCAILRGDDIDIQHILKKYGLTLSELGEFTEVNRSYLWQLMVGQREITVDMEARLKVGLRNLVKQRVADSRSATTMALADGIDLPPIDQKQARRDVEQTVSHLERLGAGGDEVASDA